MSVCASIIYKSDDDNVVDVIKTKMQL